VVATGTSRGRSHLRVGTVPGDSGQEEDMAEQGNGVIVVGVDGSPESAHALRWAIAWARRRGGDSPVQAVMAWRYPTFLLLPSPFGQAVPPADAMIDATRTAMAAVVDPVVAETGIDVEQVVVEGAAGQVLAEAAESARLLVVGHRGLGRVESVLRGSVSRRVVASVRCPVVVVPGDAALEPVGPVVVGIDGSPHSLDALRWAVSAGDGAVQAILAYEFPLGPEYELPAGTPDDPQAIAQAVVEHSVSEAVGNRDDVTARAIAGDPREVLTSGVPDASMIVVGARGESGLTGLIVGSVTTSVVAHSPVPVVVVP
jgi:nucleotide-binding universal stress UspA family protein